MIKVYLDVNVLMDFFLVRDLHFMPAAEILTLAKEKKIEAVVDARTFVFTFFHLKKKLGDSEKAKVILRKALPSLTIVSLTKTNLEQALDRELPRDLEDGAQLELALSAKADFLITGDKKGFKTKEIAVKSAPEFLKWWTKHHRA
ncbi:MAG: putative toxin-antitoxin system toxin component, PIN family [Bacteroidota bacterium]